MTTLWGGWKRASNGKGVEENCAGFSAVNASTS
jgi:hypothetical protein